MVEYFNKNNKITCVLTDRDTGQKTVGRAKCHPDDKFDVEFGKQLAFTRARYKEVQNDIKYLKNYIKTTQRFADNIIVDYMKALNKTIARSESIQCELINLESRFKNKPYSVKSSGKALKG